LKPTASRFASEKKAVAPLAGAWIETKYCPRFRMSPLVAPLAGAWIETSLVIIN